MAEVRLTPGGAPETVLPALPAELTAALEAAEGDRRRMVAIAAAHPELPEAWAGLGKLCESEARGLGDHLEAYAYYRIGYHRGLDALRHNGWRGSGYVRGSHASNRGFLASLDGLRRMAEAIGEASEAERCADFLAMLDPAYRPSPGP